MTLQQFYRYLQDNCIRGELIVSLEYWYTNDNYHYTADEIMSFDGSDEPCWFNDWDEGQQNVIVHGFVQLIDINIKNSPYYKSFDDIDTDPDWVL